MSQKASRQVRLAIASNAGGSGKTTMTTHLAYAIGAKGYKVVIVELDQNGSLVVFGRLTPPEVAEQSVATILRKSFKGNYPLVPLWSERLSTVFAIQGGQALEETIQELYGYNRRPYTLMDRLEDFPLDADLIIFDTPASLEPMGVLALAASTHVLVPLKPEYKDTRSFGGFLEWYYSKIDELRLKPKPEILGFVPTRIDLSVSVHRNILGLDEKGRKKTDINWSETLPGLIEGMGIHCFPPIKHYAIHLTASGAGQPVHLYRPGCEASKNFDPIVNQLTKLLKGK